MAQVKFPGSATTPGGGAANPADVACATTGDISLTGEQTLDGVLTSASRVLVWKQTTAKDNGIYVSAEGAWTRASDMDAAAEFISGLLFRVAGGTTYSGLFASYNGPANPVVGTDAINFSMSSSAPTYDRFVGGSAGTDTTGTWSVPVGHYRKIIVRAAGSGGGGGAGRMGAAGTLRCGGGGGGGAGLFYAEYDYAAFTAANGFAITYVAAGSVAGGAGQTGSSLNGANGTDGRDTTASEPAAT